MRRPPDEHEVARRSPAPAATGARVAAGPAAVEAPDRSPGRGERVVDQARAVESALGAALAAPDVRPAQLRERRRDDRARRAPGRARRRCRKPTAGAGCAKPIPARAELPVPASRDVTVTRTASGDGSRGPRSNSIETSVDAEPFRDAPAAAARGALRRAHARECATAVDVAAVARSSTLAAASATASAEPCVRSSSSSPLPATSAGARDEREHEEQRDRRRRRPSRARRARSCGTGRQRPRDVYPGERRQRQPQSARHVELQHSVDARAARVPAGAPSRAAASTG